jgi:hypothetical protein
VLGSLLVGVVTLVALTVGWALVQGAWARTFPERSPGGDAMAGRLGCHGCTSCENPCENGSGGDAGAVREEKS